MAIERFVNLAIIAQGILQYLAITRSEVIWQIHTKAKTGLFLTNSSISFLFISKILISNTALQPPIGRLQGKVRL
jgi:hypothetical protein